MRRHEGSSPMTKPALRAARPRLLTGCALALLTAGCNRAAAPAASAPPLDALPLTDVSSPVPPAPAAGALPAAPPARIARIAQPSEAYAYLDRADRTSAAYSEAPPDYAVDYRGSRPWVWRGGDGSERVVEITPDGQRDYYYEAGAQQPYFVQDGDYGYAYSGPSLVEVYGPGGAIEPYGFAERRAALAGRYLAWGAGLYAASLHQPRLPAEQARWEAQRYALDARRSAWAADRSRVQAWSAYHDAHAAEDAHWAAERDRRNSEIARLNQGGTGPFEGAGRPGGFATPQREPAVAIGQTQRQQTLQRLQGEAAADRLAAAQAHVAQAQAAQEQAHAGEVQARAQAEAQRQATLQRSRGQAEAQRQGAEQAHLAQVQATQAAAQARAQAEQQRRATLEQDRAHEAAQRQTADQAHAAQAEAARASENQARALQEAQRQAVAQAHANAEQQARVQADAERQAHAQAEAQRQAAAQARAAAHKADHPADPGAAQHP